MRSELLEGATAGASGTVSESGWSNDEMFKHYLQEHFLNYVTRHSLFLFSIIVTGPMYH